MRKTKSLLQVFFLILCLTWGLQTGTIAAVAEDSGASVRHEFTVFSYARDYLKQQMIKRQEKTTFTLISSEADGEKLMGRLIDAATETVSTTKGREGDYLDIHVEQYRTTCKSTPIYNSTNKKVESYEHEMTFLVRYYTTKKQEDNLTIRIAQVLSDLDLSDKSTYEKILAIYNYVCKRVRYAENTSNDEVFSAYGALVNKEAVCQGYSALLYRLFREAGIECRIIKGTSKGVAHSWNIVKIGNSFYNLDATWDAGKDPENYKYFLKTDAEFKAHTREKSYATAEFYAAFPMASEPYCFGNHSWSDTYTIDMEPTCTSYGLKSIHCVRCDEVKEGSLELVDMVKHSYGSWTVKKKATVFAKGIKKRVCTVCGKEQKASVSKVTPQVTLNAVTAKMKVGQKSTALQVIKMGYGDSIKKWTSSDSSVVSVGRKTGKLTAKKKGAATITVTLQSGVKASCKIRVIGSAVKAKSIAFEKSKRTLKVGSVLELKIVYNPITATDRITYKISNNGVLSLKDGVITAEKVGIAYVKASTKSGLIAKCKITVRK